MFNYKNGTMYCEDVSLAQVAEEYGTPAYVYSRKALQDNLAGFRAGLSGTKHLICFSVKANSNLGVLATLFEQGAGADIVSGGELFRVLQAGGDPKKVVFSGVGKTPQEMRMAIKAGILAFNVESRAELTLLNAVAKEVGQKAPVSLRVNPNVDAKTHPYISTGLKKNKFGVAHDQALAVYRLAAAMEYIEIVGVDCHIGSQLTDLTPFRDAIAKLVDLIQALGKEGIGIQYLDIGGGLGIDYGNLESEPPTPRDYGTTVQSALEPLTSLGLTIVCEPGRSIAGTAGALITKVLYQKDTGTKKFTIVDAAFNDLMRPAFYGSYHPIQPVVENTAQEKVTTDIVGPICETGDFLAKDRALPPVTADDLLWIGAAGAYGFTMSSNYNTRPRAPEVMVSGSACQLVRPRETLEQLIANEKIPTW